MIEAFSLRTAHLFQDAMASQARLRHKVFVEDRKLNHPHFEGMEYDEFDTPAAVYLAWRDEARVVRGLARLLRTDRPYMLQTYWPYLVETGPLPSSVEVCEVTRVCVDRSVNPEIRKTIFPELLCGINEYFKLHGIAAMTGVTRPHLLENFCRTGVTWLGHAQPIEGEMESAFYVPTEHIRPIRHCALYKLPERVLMLPEAPLQGIAA